MAGLNPMVQTEMTGFPGLMTNSDPRDIAPGGSQEQVNIGGVVKGTLQVRAGIRPGTFANGITPVAAAAYSMCYFIAPGNDWVVFEQADGNIRAGKGFA